MKKTATLETISVLYNHETKERKTKQKQCKKELKTI